MLLRVVQVEKYLYTGTPAPCQRFEEFLAGQLNIGTFKSKCLDIVGANLVQPPPGFVTIDVIQKIDDLQPLYSKSLHRKHGDDDATPIELAAYRSLIGKLLYIGQLVSPVAAYHASAAATKCANLRLHHLKALYAALNTMKGYAVTLTILPPKAVKFQLEAMYGASMKTVESQSNVRQGFVIFRRRGKAVHSTSWTTRRARRVARSTSTAELLAAADAVVNSPASSS